ncbi:hypothetical protein [Thermoanaerobacter sp. YS13]|nr:hypothetical protein [Thermoanaerobacter sp. YS13]
MFMTFVIVLYGTVCVFVGFMLCAVFTSGKIADLETQLMMIKNKGEYK